MAPRVKRKRGAQPGNQNARTHGFYSRFLDPVTSQNIQEVVKLNDIDEEIALLRQKIMSVLSHDPKNLAVICQASQAVNTLIRTRHLLKQYDSRKRRKTVKYILRHAANRLGSSPAKPKGAPPVSDSNPSPGHPESGEADSLARDESGTT